MICCSYLIYLFFPLPFFSKITSQPSYIGAPDSTSTLHLGLPSEAQSPAKPKLYTSLKTQVSWYGDKIRSQGLGYSCTHKCLRPYLRKIKEGRNAERRKRKWKKRFVDFNLDDIKFICNIQWIVSFYQPSQTEDPLLWETPFLIQLLIKK